MILDIARLDSDSIKLCTESYLLTTIRKPEVKLTIVKLSKIKFGENREIEPKNNIRRKHPYLKAHLVKHFLGFLSDFPYFQLHFFFAFSHFQYFNRHNIFA